MKGKLQQYNYTINEDNLFNFFIHKSSGRGMNVQKSNLKLPTSLIRSQNLKIVLMMVKTKESCVTKLTVFVQNEITYARLKVTVISHDRDIF